MSSIHNLSLTTALLMMFHPQVQYLTVITICLLTSPSAPIPLDTMSTVHTVVYENVNDGLGRYSFRFETSDGTKRNEEGNVYMDPVKGQVYRVQGSYSYMGPDGVEYIVQYTADENGFHPIISHIPVQPSKIPAKSFLSSNVVASLLG